MLVPCAAACLVPLAARKSRVPEEGRRAQDAALRALKSSRT
jgi:hypothetical protein